MIARLFLGMVLLTLAQMMSAQLPDISEPQLNSSDVEAFIKTFPKIQQEFSKLNIEYKPESDMNAFLEQLHSHKDVYTILSANGYPDFNEFVAKTWAISASYMVNKLGVNSNPEIQRAYKEIDDNENLSVEDKERAKKQLDEVFNAMTSAFSASANSQDVETIKPFVVQLDTIFQK